jgi:hypothetical protein
VLERGVPGADVDDWWRRDTERGRAWAWACGGCDVRLRWRAYGFGYAYAYAAAGGSGGVDDEAARAALRSAEVRAARASAWARRGLVWCWGGMRGGGGVVVVQAQTGWAVCSRGWCEGSE